MRLKNIFKLSLSFISLFYFLSCTTVRIVDTKNVPYESDKTNTQSSDVSDVNDSAYYSNENSATEANLISLPTRPVSRQLVEEIKKRQYEQEAPPAKIVSQESFPVNAKKIGVILPITGKGSHLSQRMLNSLRIGLNIQSNSEKTDFSLVVYDSQNDAEMAAKGVEKLIREDNVVAIVGGMTAREATAISEKADFYQIPFFTFSQKSDLTKNSDYTFRNALTAQMQVNRLVDFAVNKLKAKRFAILYPNDAYGIEFANTFWDHVLAYGGQVVGAQVYETKVSNFTPYIQKLVGTYHVENRIDEYKEKLDQIKQKEKANSKLQQRPRKSFRSHEVKENMLSPVVQFDAIFIPDSSQIMGQVIAFFKTADVPRLTYLGTNLWHTDDLYRRTGYAASAQNRFYFTDAKNSEEEVAKSAFHRAFVETFEAEPTLIETQAFETATILRREIGYGYINRRSLTERLRSLGSARGAYTNVYMNNNQEIVRPVSILSLDNALIKKID